MRLSFSKRLEACIITCLFSILSSCNFSSQKVSVTNTIDSQESLISYYEKLLSECFSSLKALEESSSQEEALINYKAARKAFKLAEPILAFEERDNYLTLDAPNILKVIEEDATDIKILSPFGFQVIEELLVEDSLDLAAVKRASNTTKNRLKLVQETVAIELNDYHLIWLFRDQVIRVASLGLSGFDSPGLNQSLLESGWTYQTLDTILDVYIENFNDTAIAKQLMQSLKKSEQELSTGDFNTFNRYEFIKDHTQQQLKLLNKVAEDWEVNYPFELAVKNNASSLFSASTFNNSHFSDQRKQSVYSDARSALGLKLFNDKRLSRSKKMSCATCHQKERAFTDGLVHFVNQKRNTPVLPYASLQKAFFYDNRAGSLEGQIVGVVNNEHEFHTDLKTFTQQVIADSSYVKAFDSTYGGEISDRTIRNAMANYIRSLNPFDAKFDRNMNKLEETMTATEVKGFNLFLGKAQCGTCHFPPVFNGTVPPYFTNTEMELLGVPDDTLNNKIDDDWGRYDVYQTAERKHFFKTPSIRNIAMTAPYMHNGVYQRLEQVVEFYDHGGGVGMGMNLPLQTLPADSLHLSEEEEMALIAFMKTLTDRRFIKN